MKFNLPVLFQYLRNSPFGGRTAQSQVDGVVAILKAARAIGVDDVRHLAYMIATAFHETGGSLKTGKESLNYTVAALRSKFSRSRIGLSEADKYGRKAGRAANQAAIANLIYGGQWGLKNLGNKETGDGWRFIGRGLVQITGRRNYTLYGLAGNPEGATDLAKAAHILVHGMSTGSFTGKKLSDYDGMVGGVKTFDAIKARATVNGTDKASLIEQHYKAILPALEAAMVQEETVGPDLDKELSCTDSVVTDDVPAAKSGTAQAIYGALGTGVVGTTIAAVNTPWAAVALVAILAVGGVFLWGHLTGKFTFNRSNAG